MNEQMTKLEQSIREELAQVVPPLTADEAIKEVMAYSKLSGYNLETKICILTVNKVGEAFIGLSLHNDKNDILRNARVVERLALKRGVFIAFDDQAGNPMFRRFISQ